MESVAAAVRTRWGSSLREHQRAALEGVLAGRDVLVCVATGGGKSLIYQAAACVRPPVLVVSPLLSLMQDQVADARARGIDALNLSTDPFRLADLVYATPERAVHLAQHPWSLVAVDEAHCVVQWGLDFRPEYAQLQVLRGAPVVALTASATPQMQSQICTSLQLRNPVRVQGTYARPNLVLRIASKSELQRCVEPPCIVYVTTRKEAEDVAQSLGMFKTAPYHAGMAEGERQQIVDLFLADEIRVVVATIAFGMGINKPDVRSIVNYGPPRTLEEYYQEIGRAGRDGSPSNCTLLVEKGDWVRLRHSGADVAALNHVEAYARSTRCLHQRLVKYFGENIPPCGKCSACLAPAGPDFDGEPVVDMVGKFPFFGAKGIELALRGDKSANPKLKDTKHFGTWRGVASREVARRIAYLLDAGILVQSPRTIQGGRTYNALQIPTDPKK